MVIVRVSVSAVTGTFATAASPARGARPPDGPGPDRGRTAPRREALSYARARGSP